MKFISPLLLSSVMGLLVSLPGAGLQAIENNPARPTIWVYSDMSDPRDQRAGGHPQNDPDDICSMAALLLEANRFNIAGIVFSSTNRKGLRDATPFVEETFVAAYAMAREPLQAALGGFPESIPFHRSSLYKGEFPEKFDPGKDYSSLEDLPTVAGLIRVAEQGPVHVLNWGPLSESAIAVKHCLDTGNMEALENILILSHWTTSYIAQGTPETPFKVANCRDDAEACDFLHQMAQSHPAVRFVELGSVGQTGVVNGSEGFSRFSGFTGSALGQVFVHSKFYHGKQDQSDGSTFWLLTGAFGPGLEAYRHDGSLDQETEETVRDLFLENGHAILDDLLERSRIAAAGGAFGEAFIASCFTYVYQFLDGRYAAHVPYEARLVMEHPDGTIVMDAQLPAGNHRLEVDTFPAATYTVRVTCGGLTRTFELKVSKS